MRISCLAGPHIIRCTHFEVVIIWAFVPIGSYEEGDMAVWSGGADDVPSLEIDDMWQGLLHTDHLLSDLLFDRMIEKLTHGSLEIPDEQLPSLRRMCHERIAPAPLSGVR